MFSRRTEFSIGKQESAKVNGTNPESRILMTAKIYCQGYNAQAVVTEDQVFVAADITQEENDAHQPHPMLDKTETNSEGFRAALATDVRSALFRT